MDYLIYRLDSDLIRRTLHYSYWDQNTSPVEAAAYYAVIFSLSLAFSAQVFKTILCHAEKSLIQ